MTVSPLNRDFIAGFQRGSFESVRELYHLYYPSLTGFAEQLTLSAEDAHNIVLDTFIKLLLMRDRFDNMPDIKAFLYITVRNTCFSWLQSKSRNQSSNSEAWYLNDESINNRLYEEPARTKVIQEMFEEANRLPQPARDVFRLIYSNRLPVPRVAEQLGIDQPAVVAERVRAVEAIRLTLIQKEVFSVPLFIYFLAIAFREQQGNIE